MSMDFFFLICFDENSNNFIVNLHFLPIPLMLAKFQDYLRSIKLFDLLNMSLLIKKYIIFDWHKL